MNRQLPTPVRLERNDSINLSTGKITRDFAPAKGTVVELIFNGVRRNDLRFLQTLITRNAVLGRIKIVCADCHQATHDLYRHRHGDHSA